MASCEHLQRTSMYFDGELAPGDERDAADHIATCEQCQAMLGDAAGIDAVLSQAKRAPATAAPQRAIPRRRWPVVLGAATFVAAAAIAIIVLLPRPRSQPGPEQPERVALVLPQKRSLEARFTGEQLGAHRPYEAPRERAHEAIDVLALRELERLGKTHDLVGALASTGELVRAAEIARALPTGAPAQSDLAALALAAGDPETALDHAYRALSLDRELPAASWNLALAARQLKYWRVSRAAFARVAAYAEPGWAAEASQHIALLDHQLDRAAAIASLRSQFRLLVSAGSVRATITDPALRENADMAEFQRRSRSIIADETPIELALVRRFPSHAWVFFYEALASATRDIVEGLEPVAEELDRISSTTAATELAKRAVANRVKIARIAKLLQVRPIDTAIRAELHKLAIDDPFVALHVAVEPAEIPDRCRSDAFALPCAPIVYAVARRQFLGNKLDEAVRSAELARDIALLANTPIDYRFLSEVHRRVGRSALARADVEEATLGSP